MKQGDLKKQEVGTSGTRRGEQWDQGTRKNRWSQRWRKAGSGERNSGTRTGGRDQEKEQGDEDIWDQERGQG